MNIYKKDLKPFFNIIDIRDKDLYEEGHIFDSVNIPMNTLLNNVANYLNKKDIYYIYCEKGYNSKKTCDLLSILGYKVVNVIDGYRG